MAELRSEPLQDIIPGPSSRNPVSAEEGHSHMTEFPNTLAAETWHLLQFSRMQINNSRGVAAAMMGYRLKRNRVWGDEFSLIRADDVPQKSQLVWGWETLYEHKADRKHHKPMNQQKYSKGVGWALLPLPEVTLCSHRYHPVGLT